MYAVDHLNMTVPQGEIYGFIGENGSGNPPLRSSSAVISFLTAVI